MKRFHVEFIGGPYDGRKEDYAILNRLKEPEDPWKERAGVWVPHPDEDNNTWYLYETDAPYAEEIPCWDAVIYFTRSAPGDCFGPFELLSPLRNPGTK